MPSRPFAKTAVIALCLITLLSVDTRPPRVLDRSIRSFDFGNASWLDHNDSGGPYEVTAATFADADGDGDEDALVGLAVKDNAALTTYYIWKWDQGRAVQVAFPAYATLRCGPQLRRISGHRDGFEIHATIRLPDEPCAADPTQPVQMIVGLRDGYPLQLSPQLGYASHCRREGMHTTLVSRPLPVRVAPEEAATAVAEIQPGQRILLFPSLGFEAGPGWRLLIVPGGDQEICGWVYAGPESFGRVVPQPVRSRGPGA